MLQRFIHILLKESFSPSTVTSFAFHGLSIETFLLLSEQESSSLCKAAVLHGQRGMTQTYHRKSMQIRDRSLITCGEGWKTFSYI